MLELKRSQIGQRRDGTAGRRRDGAKRQNPFRPHPLPAVGCAPAGNDPVSPSPRLPLLARLVRASVATLGEERQIACLRLPFTLPPLLVFQGSLGPTAHPGLTAAAAVLYALYALAVAFDALRADRAPDTRRARRFAFVAPLTLGLDLVLTSLLVYAIGVPATPAALQYLHALFAAAVRWGPRGAAATAVSGGLLAVAALLPATGAARSLGAAAGPPQALGPIGFANLYLLGAALLGGRFCGIFDRRGHQAVSAERDRIARDLHDDFVQTLVAAGLRVEFCRSLLESTCGAVPGAQCPVPGSDKSPHLPQPGTGHRAPGTSLQTELESLHAMLAQSLKDARSYLVGMRPALRQGLTLAACLERCAAEIFRGLPVATSVAVIPPNPNLAREVETAAFYIAREALFNARKHAAPGHVMVTLECRHEIVTVTVTDDGRGTSEERLTAAEGHGLRNMRGRAEAIGGTLRVVTTPGEGTCVNAELPFQPRHIRPLETSGF